MFELIRILFLLPIGIFLASALSRRACGIAPLMPSDSDESQSQAADSQASASRVSALEDGSSVSSQSDSDDYEDHGLQLEYILEYVTRNPEYSLPEQSFNDLLSLICDGESQPAMVPPYLLAAACRTIFPTALEDASFEESGVALQHFDQLESIRRNYLAELERKDVSGSGINQLGLDKVLRETEKIYSFAWLALRRWTVINEIHTQPFSAMNCIAKMNELYKYADYIDSSMIYKERTAITQIIHRVKTHLAKGRGIYRLTILSDYEAKIPYLTAQAAMSRFLELSQYTIGSIEDFIDPLPKELREKGLRRKDCVLHRISKDLMDREEHEFKPEFDYDGANDEMSDDTSEDEEIKPDESIVDDASIAKVPNPRFKRRVIRLSPEI